MLTHIHTSAHLEMCWRLVAVLEAGSSQSSMKTQIVKLRYVHVHGADFNGKLENQNGLSKVCSSSGLEKKSIQNHSE